MRSWIAWLCLGAAACAGVESVPEEEEVAAEAPPPEVVVLTPTTDEVRTPTVTVEVLALEAERTAEGWAITASLLFRHRREVPFDGLTGKGQSVLLTLDDIRLEVAGTSLPPSGVEHITEAIDESQVLVPVLPPRQALSRMRWDLPGETLPNELVLRVTAEGAVGEAWLQGRPTLDGAPAVVVQPVAIGGRPVLQAGTVTYGDTVQAVSGDGWPVRIPSGPFSVQMDGYVSAEAEAEAAVVWPMMVPQDDTASKEASLAELFAAVDAPPVRNVSALMGRIKTAEDVIAYVRDETGVLRTRGLARSPDAVVALGAGSPIERAMLARELLERLRFETRFSCGDLPKEEADALYADRVAVPAVPDALRDEVETLRAKVDALAGPLAASFEGWEERPIGRPGTIALVPEWCWVSFRPKGDQAAPFRSYDLRPDSTEAPPFLWRSAMPMSPEVWRASITLNATLRGAAGTVQLTRREVSAVSLTDGALLFDIYPSPTKGKMRGHVAYVLDDETAGRAGSDVNLVDVDNISLLMGSADPRDVVNRSRSIDLWQRADGNAPPRFIRVLLSIDPGMPDLSRTALLLQDAVQGASQTPDVSAMRAHHALWSWLRFVLSDGAMLDDPLTLITVLTMQADGVMTSRTLTLGTPLPVNHGEPPSAQALARYAAIDAVIRATLEGDEVPPVPTVWMRDGRDLEAYPAPSTVAQIGVARRLARVGFGADPSGDLWSVDREGGGLSWAHLFETPLSPAPDPGGETVEGARLPYATWSLPVRCREARRWGAWLDVAVPAFCAAPEAVAP